MWTYCNNFPASILKTTTVASPSPPHPPHTHSLLTKSRRLPFVWLKCSVGILRSRLRVIRTEKWNRVVTVRSGIRISGYPAQPHQVQWSCSACSFAQLLKKEGESVTTEISVFLKWAETGCLVFL